MTMMKESGLTMAFWGEALAALIHVWNRCPTVALDNATPYELWNGCKPDVSHLRVWGHTAYVHGQKDKHPALHPHYEKCVFIGYPDGYKGWKFYNPSMKHTLISECADFDEQPAAVATGTPTTVPAVRCSTPDLPGDVDEDKPLPAAEMPPPQGDLDDKDTPLPLSPAPPATPPPAPGRAPSPVSIGI
jgi:hypothetical protein